MLNAAGGAPTSVGGERVRAVSRSDQVVDRQYESGSRVTPAAWLRNTPSIASPRVGRSTAGAPDPATAAAIP